MSYLLNNQQKLNDVIFLNRNQNYGAYAIRSNYGETVLKSLLLMIFGFSILFSFTWFLSAHPQTDPPQKLILPPTQDSIYEIEVNTKREESLNQDTKEKKSEKIDQKETSPFVTVIDSLKTESLLNDSVKEKTNTISITTTGSGNDTSSTDGNKGNGKKIVRRDSIMEDFGVDTAPEFEGGLKALYGFISSHLRYPEDASVEGRGGTVRVKFVVDENGYVSRLFLLNKLGQDLNNEALRVVSMIPKFKSPGKVNGVAVKTYYMLPIKFRSQ